MLQADYALSRLVTLKERTEATESLAKMHLSQRRNELVSFELLLNVISINVAFFGGVASLCGMNLWLAGSNAPSVTLNSIPPMLQCTDKYASQKHLSRCLYIMHGSCSLF